MYKKNKIRDLIVLSCILIVLNSCTTIKSKQNFDNNSYPDFCNSLIAYRLLYDYDYNPKINRKSFWVGKYNDDFAISKMNIAYDYLLNDIKKLPKSDRLDEYYYAFVYECKDTLYSNYCIDKWELRSNNKSTYYIFPDSLKTKANYRDLRETILSYNFLKNHDCIDGWREQK